MNPPPVDQLPGFVHLEPRAPERYCRRCQAPLPRSGTTRCGVCGREFDPDNPLTYLDQREFSSWAFWFPAFCLAVACGTIPYALISQASYDMRFVGTNLMTALWVALLVSCPIVLGYGAGREERSKGIVLILAWVSVLFVLAEESPLAILALVFILPCCMAPILLGLGIGWLLRAMLLTSKWDQRWFLPPSVVRSETTPGLHLTRHRDKSIPPPRRRPPQFHLGGLLVFMGGLAAPLTILGMLDAPPLWLGFGAGVIATAVAFFILLLHRVRFRRC